MSNLKVMLVDARNGKALAYVLVNFGMFLKTSYHQLT